MPRLLPVAAVSAAALLIAGAFTILPATQSPASTPSPSAEVSASPTPSTVPPTPTLSADQFGIGDVPPTPVPTPGWVAPDGYTGPLHPGAWATITGTDSCLNVRITPALFYHNPDGDFDVPLLNCLPDGFVGQLSLGPQAYTEGQAMPIQADGHWWWNLLGQGWVAEDWLAFLQDDPPYAQRTDLVGAGLIAYGRSDGVWLVGADGSSPHLIYPVNTNNGGISTIDWSPDGQTIAVSVYRWNEADEVSRSVTAILDLNGNVVTEYRGLSQASWSPDGRSLAGMRTRIADQFGNAEATAVVFNLDTGADTPLGPAGGVQGTAEWSPDGASLALVCRSYSWQEQRPDGAIVDHTIDCGGDGVRAVSAADGSGRVVLTADPSGNVYYEGPSWSPDGRTLAVFSSGGDCTGYQLVDVASGATTGCLQVPVRVSGGGCGIGREIGSSDWSPDGQTLVYHWQSSSGENGIALVNVTTGERKMIPSTFASNVNFSTDGAHLSFESAGYVWVADADGTNVSRVTDGWAPAWQPLS